MHLDCRLFAWANISGVQVKRKGKKQSNREAQEHVPHVMERIEKADDPINIALKAAIGGNIIDYGAQSSFDLDATMDRVFTMDFAIDDEAILTDALEKADSIAYLADTAGEIVFDKVLIETLMKEQGKKNVLFVVRDDPMLNDALLEDTEEIGLSALDNVEVATMPPRIPDASEKAYSIWERIEKSDVVISKGQGNYEAFSSQAGIFFLLMAKCELIAGDINQRINSHLKVGDMILWKGDGEMSYES